MQTATHQANECTRLGPLEKFVERLDEGAAARSLHALAGGLHRTLGREPELLAWIAQVRLRFDALQSAIFDCEAGQAQAARILSDPRGASACLAAIKAVAASVASCVPGEAVAFTGWNVDASHRVTAAGVLLEGSRVLGLAIAHHRESAADDEALLQYVAALTWHLRCADEATAEMRQLADRPSAADLVEMLPLPCVLTDFAGRSLDRNHEFEEFMQSSGLRMSMGRLHFEDQFLQDSWQVALREAQATVVRQSMLVASAESDQWRLHLVPIHARLHEGDTMDRPLVLAVAERVAFGTEIVLERMLHDDMRPLTPAERQVLEGLLQGHSAKVIANSRGASVNTVRSQIMTILEKTGHNNQKSLIASFAPSSFRSSMNASYPPSQQRSTRARR